MFETAQHEEGERETGRDKIQCEMSRERSKETEIQEKKEEERRKNDRNVSGNPEFAIFHLDYRV